MYVLENLANHRYVPYISFYLIALKLLITVIYYSTYLFMFIIVLQFFKVELANTRNLARHYRHLLATEGGLGSIDQMRAAPYGALFSKWRQRVILH